MNFAVGLFLGVPSLCLDYDTVALEIENVLGGTVAAFLGKT